jgi:Bacterial regulatory proteins, tetR family./Tetracyclin repressor, C-terminal all-alpha domain.
MGSDAEGDKPARLAWWPEVRDRSSDRQPLSRSQIVAAAIKLIDEEGLDGFSMRRLGQALGAGTTSFYWHVKDKDQLIDLVMDQIATEVRLDDDAGRPWRERAAYLAREFHAIGKRHRNVAALYGARISMGPNTLLAMDHLLEVLRAGGFERDRLTLAFSSLMTYALGSAVMESRDLSGPGAEGKSAEEMQAMFAEMLASLPADQFPNLVRLIAEGNSGNVDDDAQFEYGLQSMLNGMEADLNRSIDRP